MTFAKGSVVKLTDAYAATLMRSKRTRAKTNWFLRRGEVMWSNSVQVAIKWEGNKVSGDPTPLRAVELAEKCAEPLGQLFGQVTQPSV